MLLHSLLLKLCALPLQLQVHFLLLPSIFASGRLLSCNDVLSHPTGRFPNTGLQRIDLFLSLGHVRVMVKKVGDGAPDERVDTLTTSALAAVFSNKLLGKQCL